MIWCSIESSLLRMRVHVNVDFGEEEQAPNAMWLPAQVEILLAACHRA